jgi:hypothetical protein
LHGIPIVLKDNFNTFDMPTTAGSQLLEGSIPPAGFEHEPDSGPTEVQGS